MVWVLFPVLNASKVTSRESSLKEAGKGGERSALALEVLKALYKRCAASF